MAYFTGSQGAEANCSKVFMESVLDPALLTAGFVFVEQVLNSMITSRIYKSPAASNFFGSDWFLVLKRNSDTSSQIFSSVCELYDSAEHVCRNYAPSATNGLTPTSVFAVNDATGKAPDNSALKFVEIRVNTTGFQYWLSLTPDRVAMATRDGSTDYAVYAGLYDNMQSASINPFPLLVWPISASNTTNTGAATREPNTLTAVNGNFLLSSAGGGGSPPPPYWTVSFADVYSGKTLLAKITPRGRGLRGSLRGVWQAYGISGVNGDTLNATIGGTPKTLVQMAYGSNPALFVDTTL